MTGEPKPKPKRRVAMATTRGQSEWQRSIEQTLDNHEKRLSDAEKESAVYKALQAEQARNLSDRFNRVQDNINDSRKASEIASAGLGNEIKAIKADIKKVLMAVVVAIALAFVQFVINGGLKQL